MLKDEWQIDRMVPGGDGFARLPDGRVGFCADSAPGDRIEVLDVEDHRSYLRATRFALASPGPGRVDPPCPAAHTCGGCDWMHLSRATQLEQKARMLREALARTGGFHQLPESLAMVSAGAAERYRGRLRLHVDRSGHLGLFAKASHELVEVESCMVADEDVERAMLEVREVAAAHPGELACFAEVDIRVAPAGPRVTLHLRRREDRPAGGEDLIAELSQRFSVAVSGAEGDAGEQRWPLPGGVELWAPAAAFTQVNWAVNEKLIEAVLAGAASRGVQHFCDLYCGAGNFTLPLLRAGIDGVGVDRGGTAIRAARRAAKAQGLSAAAFVAGDVRHTLPDLVRSGRRFDLVLMDPPRTGARDVLHEVTGLKAPHLAVVSCDPVTLARDLKRLARSGYELDEVTGFDMFPHTHHLEALAWLRRRE